MRADEARALIVTYVVRNSLDEQVVARAEEWETTLQRYFQDLVPVAAELGLELAFSTGISLESELAKSASADVLIVVLSYAIMFGYISLNLGSSGAGLLNSTGRGLVALLKALSQLVQMLPVGASAGRARSASLSMVGSSFARRQLVESKFLLGPSPSHSRAWLILRRSLGDCDRSAVRVHLGRPLLRRGRQGDSHHRASDSVPYSRDRGRQRVPARARARPTE